MKIAILNIFYYPNVVGGAEISVQKLAEELAKQHEVYVICDGKEKKDFEEINGVKVCRVPVAIAYRNKVEEILTRSYKVQCSSVIENVLKAIKPDVLHTNNLHQFSVIVWSIARKLNIPVIHTLRDYSLLNRARMFENLIIKHCSQSIAAITAPSAFTLEKFRKSGYFELAKYQEVVPNAVDYKKDIVKREQEKKMNTPNDKPIKFAYLGRYSKEKGLDWLLEVFRSYTGNSELYLFGHGDLAKESLDVIESDSRVVNRGFLSQSDLDTALKEIDVIIVPSLWDEPFGRVIIDGYKHSCPVIVTKRGGMPEVVDALETGVILQSERDEDLLEAIQYLSNRANVKKMICNTVIKLQQYSVEAQAKKFESLYQSIKE